MMKYLKHIKYILAHKWYVFLECWRMGIIWRGLTHDLSKFVSSEFIPCTNYFFGDNKDSREDEGCDFGWLLHHKRSTHHWQFYTLPYNNGKVKILEMPDKDRKEMLADWIGTARVKKRKYSTREWYRRNKGEIQLHPKTREWLEEQFHREPV